MKLYVGNLSYEVEENDLREAFGAFGEIISLTLMKDKYTGQSRGFAFIEMSNDAAQAAMSALNDKELKGRSMKINEAHPQPERGARGGGFGGRRGAGGGGRGGREPRRGGRR